MVLSEVLGKDARIWVKSEWGPASEEWPAVSFSKRSVGETLRKELVPGRDAVLYIGTSNPATTETPHIGSDFFPPSTLSPSSCLRRAIAS
jgi:hypothetical protein